MTKRMRPIPGIVTPATIGWNIVKSSWSPRKYQGAFDGLGVLLKSASSSSGALTKIENKRVNNVIPSAARNSITRRCGQTWTLSTGVAFVSWIDPDFTTASNRWVLPSGPVPKPGSEDSTGADWSDAAFPRSRRCAGIFSSVEEASPDVVGASDSGDEELSPLL